MVEIQETVPVDEEVIAACQQLKLEGYRVALDTFVLGDGREQLVSHADYLNVDVRRVPRQHCAALVTKYGDQCTLIAQKVETRLQFTTAVKGGFTLFPGPTYSCQSGQPVAAP